jgi:hypothetical protein
MPAAQTTRKRTAARSRAERLATKPADPIAERGAQLDAARARYSATENEVWSDYRAATAELFARAEARLGGAAAEYQAEVERIRQDRE